MNLNLKERLKSFGNAFRGIVRLFIEEPHARIHLIALLMVIAGGSYFQVSGLEWCALLLSGGLVLGMEALNAAIENLADRVCEEEDPKIGKTKDLAAGGVLLGAIAAASVAGWIFLPKIC